MSKTNTLRPVILKENKQPIGKIRFAPYLCEPKSAFIRHSCKLLSDNRYCNCRPVIIAILKSEKNMRKKRVENA